MSKNKHHFVPQFYLRCFAADSKRRQVHLYNLARNQAFQSVGLKDQCYRNHFHGESDEIEDALAELEGIIAPVLARITAKSRLPSYGTEDHAVILLFVAYQFYRTARAADQANVRLDQMSKVYAQTSPDLRHISPNDYKVSYNRPVMVGLDSAPKIAPYWADLRLSLIQAPEKSHFITSDHPVFKYNLFHEGLTGFSMVGAKSRGLQILVPLSPHHLLMLFDRDIYALKKSADNVVTASIQDMAFLNGCQIVNAQANLFFDSWDMLPELKVNVEKFAPKRIESACIEEHEEVEQDDPRGSSTLVHLYEQVPDLNLRLSFLKLTKKAKQIPLRHKLKASNRSRPTSMNPEESTFLSKDTDTLPLPNLPRNRKIYKRSKTSP